MTWGNANLHLFEQSQIFSIRKSQFPSSKQRLLWNFSKGSYAPDSPGHIFMLLNFWDCFGALHSYALRGEKTNGRCIHTQLSTTDQRRSLFLRNPEGNKHKISAADTSMSGSDVSTQHPAESKCAAIIDHCSLSALKWSVVSMRKWSPARLLWLVAGKTGVPFLLDLSNGHANPKAKTV